MLRSLQKPNFLLVWQKSSRNRVMESRQAHNLKTLVRIGLPQQVLQKAPLGAFFATCF